MPDIGEKASTDVSCGGKAFRLTETSDIGRILPAILNWRCSDHDMNRTYRVLVVGLGKRGLHHATFFKANPRFELVGVSSRDPARLQNALSKLGNVPSSSNARALALSTKPDVFCFCTPPDDRLGMIKLGLHCVAKLIALEKPVALTSNELFAMRDRIRKAGVKA